jgi:putative FmdB family regulatory protein
MPIYEYRCSRCGEQFDRFVRTAAETRETACPACSSRSVVKVPSTFALGKAPASPGSGASCCGLTEPCVDPKRCCQQ